MVVSGMVHSFLSSWLQQTYSLPVGASFWGGGHHWWAVGVVWGR